jgi:hypothetical protein
MLYTNPPMVAYELRRQADYFIDLVDPQQEIGRTRPTRQSPAARPRSGPLRGFEPGRDLAGKPTTPTGGGLPLVFLRSKGYA